MGTTKVPAAPKRVVVLDTDKIDTALTLGVKPVGAARAGELNGWPTYFGAGRDRRHQGGRRARRARPRGASPRCKPDLILGCKFRQEKFYDELSKIAPTVFTENVGKTWKENFLLDGKALGKEQQAKDLLAAYEKRAKELGATDPNAATAEDLDGAVHARPHPRLRPGVASPASCSATSGCGRPDRQLLADKDDKRFDKVSPERLAEVDGDFIFVSAYGEKAAAEQAKITGGTLWATLAAVKAGKARSRWPTRPG